LAQFCDVAKNGDYDPLEDLAKFGYKLLNMEVFFLKKVKHPSIHFWLHILESMYRKGRFFFFSILVELWLRGKSVKWRISVLNDKFGFCCTCFFALTRAWQDGTRV
jgi:hypothetical protein